MKQFLLGFFSVALLSVAISSCSEDDDDIITGDTYNISATMNSAQEVGANTSASNPSAFPGTGSVTGTYNATSNVLQYNLSWSGLSGAASQGHFHGPALAGASAGALIHFNLLNNGTAGSASGSITLTDTQEADLLAGKWYANIHTAANPGGEIRGQVSASK